MPKLWCLVKLTAVSRGSGDSAIEVDHVFFSNGSTMNSDERKLRNLKRDGEEEGFLIWHEWVVQRVRSVRSVKKPAKGKKRK